MRRVVWTAFALALAALTIVSAWRVHRGSGRPAELPVYGRVPSFALVDPQRRIRGYYHGTDPDDVARLERDVALLSGSGT